MSCIPIVFIVGITRICQSAIGMANRTIMESPFYMWSTYFNLSKMVVVVLTNLWLIPQYELIGAALATAFSNILFAIVRVVFIKVRYGFYSYSPRILTIGIVGTLGILAIWWLPKSGFALLDMSIRSLLSVIYFGLVSYLLRLSPEVNGFINKIVFKRK